MSPLHHLLSHYLTVQFPQCDTAHVKLDTLIVRARVHVHVHNRRRTLFVHRVVYGTFKGSITYHFIMGRTIFVTGRGLFNPCLLEMAANPP